MKSTFKYNHSDFGPLPVRLEHCDIQLNFVADRVEGEIVLRMTALQELDKLVLDAKDLDIREVTSPDDEGRSLSYEYDRAAGKLVAELPARVQPGNAFNVRVCCACVPSDRILEGIYKDTTPDGCPQQYVSQCQQWGFQRILPILDDCRAKCTMSTTLEADAAYTHLISNGNISRSLNPAGKPIPKPGDSARQVITYENFVPMAPYLFVVCVGTWDVLEDEVLYPSGKQVRLEYLVPPGRRAGARIPMQILKDSVLWQNRTQGYEYSGDVYRTICMEKSNFGGMENMGNTTIVTDAALIDEYTDDARLLYAYGVIVHEFEHNQCGSEVTMETPFDMWLNEAYTVDVERQFVASRFDPTFVRLMEVDRIRSPLGGPLGIEDAGRQGNIVREGFNDPDELVDGVTYVKAAEVIRMLRLVLGHEAFERGRALYFERYRGGNANTDQFLACFEEVSGRDLAQFRKEWLLTIGYPHLTVETRYEPEARRVCVTVRQTRTGEGGLFHVPLQLAVVSCEGIVLPGTDAVVEITEPEQTVEIDGVAAPPAFVSFNGDCSFYGTFMERGVTPDGLFERARLEPNPFNRVEAVRRVTDLERIRLVEDIRASVSDAWLDLYGDLIADTAMPAGLKSYFLRIDEQAMDRSYLTRYRVLYAARKKLMETVADRHMARLVDVYQATDTYARGTEPRDGIEERRLKVILLGLISAANTTRTHELAEAHFRKAWNISDRLGALSALYRSDHPNRQALMEEAYAEWSPHLSAYSGYLRLIGMGTHDDVFDLMAREESRATFIDTHPTLLRALHLSMTLNNKMLWTDRGIDWLTRTVIKLGAANENVALLLVSSLQHVQRLADDLSPKVLAALEKMRTGIDKASVPALGGRIDSFLA